MGKFIVLLLGKEPLVHQNMVVGAESDDIVRVNASILSGWDDVAKFDDAIKAADEACFLVEVTDILSTASIKIHLGSAWVEASPFHRAGFAAKDLCRSTSSKARSFPRDWLATEFARFGLFATQCLVFAVQSTEVFLIKLQFVRAYLKSYATIMAGNCWPASWLSFGHFSLSVVGGGGV